MYGYRKTLGTTRAFCKGLLILKYYKEIRIAHSNYELANDIEMKIIDLGNPDATFKRVNLLHLVSFIMQALFIVLVYMVVWQKTSFQLTNVQTLSYIQYLFIIIAMASIPLSEYLVKEKQKKAMQIEDKNQRFASYLIFLIVKLAFIESINFMAIIMYFLSGQDTFFYISLIFTLFFLMSRPAKEKTMNELNL
jgi:hypothetical protein